MTLKKIGTTLGIIAGIITLLGMLYSYDQDIVKAEDLKALSVVVHEKAEEGDLRTLAGIVQDMKLNDRLHNLQKRLWSLEDRYEDKTKMSKDDKDEYRRLQQEIEELRRQLDNKENPDG